MKDRPATAIAVGLYALFFVLLFGAVYVIGNVREQIECNQYHENTGRETKFKWSLATSCYVNTDDGWYRLDQVRGLN